MKLNNFFKSIQQSIFIVLLLCLAAPALHAYVLPLPM